MNTLSVLEREGRRGRKTEGSREKANKKLIAADPRILYIPCI
jgi:hypothetical protein